MAHRQQHLSILRAQRAMYEGVSKEWCLSIGVGRGLRPEEVPCQNFKKEWTFQLQRVGKHKEQGQATEQMRWQVVVRVGGGQISWTLTRCRW